MTDLLNVFGRQTIANIEMSPIEEKSNTIQHGTNARGEPTSDLYGTGLDGESESGSQKGTEPLEVDLSSPQELRLLGGPRRSKKRHIFSQIQTYRGPEVDEEAAGTRNDLGANRLRRPKVHKYVRVLLE